MKKVAKFEKVYFKQFLKDFRDCFGDKMSEIEIKEIYDKIELPKRATKYSAGYDFYCPISVLLTPGETVKFPTGIRCKMQEDYVLMLYPRSGLGFKYRMQLNNTVGVIDADYYNSSNEGHIMAKITNDTNEDKSIVLNAGEGFMQGIFMEYAITEDDRADAVRDGGFGSTTKR